MLEGKYVTDMEEPTSIAKTIITCVIKQLLALNKYCKNDHKMCNKEVIWVKQVLQKPNEQTNMVNKDFFFKEKHFLLFLLQI